MCEKLEFLLKFDFLGLLIFVRMIIIKLKFNAFFFEKMMEKAFVKLRGFLSYCGVFKAVQALANSLRGPAIFCGLMGGWMGA